MVKNIWIKKGAFIFMIFALLITIAGCGSGGEEVDYDKLILVTYDANGGYLRNKVDTIRKLRVYMNSKLPNHNVDGENVPYALASLGKAAREGYNLLGWYLEENATYNEDANGDFVYLDRNYNNGIYTAKTDGEYVFKYTEDENGSYVFIYVEEVNENDNINELKYIFFKGSEGLGFYKYDSDNAEHADIYKKNGGFEASKLAYKRPSYLFFKTLSEEDKKLFVEADRYNGSFELYTLGDDLFERYSLNSGYIQAEAMMYNDNEEGLYVYLNDKYELYDAENASHKDLDRYSIHPRYLFTPSEEVYSPSDLTRYSISIKYWDFEKDRVSKDIILKAHWTKKITVEFHQANDQIKTITTKMNDNKTKEVPLVRGETIGKLEAVPLLAGYTFVNWSTSPTEYLPWDFDTDVFPIDTTLLKLYAYMVEGTYTRITSSFDLAKVSIKPDDNYLLCNDIDLKGEVFINESPLGFIVETTLSPLINKFTGEFLSLGHEISNFTLKVQNKQKSILKDSGITAVLGLFPYVENAKIEGLIVTNVFVQIDNDQSGSNIVCDLGAGGIIGTSLEGNTIVNNISVDITFVKTTSKILESIVYVGDIVGRGIENTTITNSTANIDYTDLTNITTGTLKVQTLN